MKLEEMDIYWDAAKKIIAENQSLWNGYQLGF
jgi:hypothetical protein